MSDEEIFIVLTPKMFRVFLNDHMKYLKRRNK